MKLDIRNTKFFKKMLAVALVPFVLGGSLTLTSCGDTKEESGYTQVDVDYDSIIKLVKEKLKEIYPGMNDQLIENYTLVLLLDLLAREDNNGKVNSSIISDYKQVIDVNNMMNDFNSVLNILENTMIQDNKLMRFSQMLPVELIENKNILYSIETITGKIIDLINANASKAEIKDEFDKLYTLFVEEDTLDLNGYTFNIRDLSYPIRALASSYARTATYFAGVNKVITEEEYIAMDQRTNHQNSKPYIKEKLEILSNGIEEESEIDVVNVFDNKYKEIQAAMDNHISIDAKKTKLLIDCLNMEYLSSDKVATKDRNTVFGEYSDDKVSDIILTIDASYAYSLNQYQNNVNTTNIFDYSKLLITEYSESQKGKIDAIALNYILSEALNLSLNINENIIYNDLINNEHFKNLCLYITKQDFNHGKLDENGKIVGLTEISFQSISDGTNLVCNEIIRYTLEYIKNIIKFSSYEEEIYNTYLEKVNSNLEESIQAYQNVVLGECKKVDVKEYVKK